VGLFVEDDEDDDDVVVVPKQESHISFEVKETFKTIPEKSFFFKKKKKT